MQAQTTESPEFQEALSKIKKVIDGRPVEQQRRILEGALRLEEEAQAEKRRKLAAMEALRAWLETNAPIKLERNDYSRLHTFKEAALADRVIKYPNEVIKPPKFLGDGDHIFVVKHDWAAVFEHAEGIEDEIRLPYDNCVFEFRIGGKTILLIGHQAADAGSAPIILEFLESQGYWYSPPIEEADELTKYLLAQVRAICIALDAEVATYSVIRAPHKLNEKRARQGKPKLSDFHVIDLARRHRVANPSGQVGVAGKKRLHFRRGHWRHFETSKTWVRWCLVGDPDLGFIQKQYTL